jgi:hypothetical protein
MEGLKELQKQVDALNNKFIDFQFKKSLDEIILNSKYVVLGFQGIADGATLLTKSFADQTIRSKNLLLKSLRIIPYYSADTVDIELTDGVTTTTETIGTGIRVNRILDSYTGAVASFLRLLIDSKNEIFNVSNTGNVDLLPPDFEFDNAYALYKSIQNIDMVCYFEVNDPAGSTPINPYVKIYLECYLF